MSVFQPDTGSGQPTAHGLPAFRVVRRGYDPTQVDAYIPQLVARLEEAERARVELQREVASLQRQAPPTFEQLGADAAEDAGLGQGDREAALDQETSHDGLEALERTRGRVGEHREAGTLVEQAADGSAVGRRRFIHGPLVIGVRATPVDPWRE